MRHNRDIKRFNRSSSHLRATMNNLASSLIAHERIKTTVPKAKELRRVVERLITLGKRGDLHARRKTFMRLKNRTLVKKLFDNIAPRYEKRNGGYTRIMRVAHRRGDNAPIAVIELVEEKIGEKKKSD
jgi:large subunit ribosomal protein L17